MTMHEVFTSEARFSFITDDNEVSNTVMNILYLLAKNPEKQSKLRNEILENPKQKRYLRACISEAMRMLPAGSTNLRLASKEHHMLGYKIPTDVQIIFCLQSMSNMEEYFPKPDQYIPERWLVGKDDPLCGKTHLFANRNDPLWFWSSNVCRSVSVTSCPVSHDGQGIQSLKPWREIPGPPSLPVVGPLFSFLPGGNLAGYSLVELLNRLYQLYGPIVRLDGGLGRKDSLYLFDPEAVECVLRTEESMPIRPGMESLEYYRKRHNKTYDPARVTGLITDHGKNWRDFRTAVNPIMMQPKAIQLYNDVMKEVADEMITCIRSMRDVNDKITKDLDLKCHLWALESIAVVALGQRLNCFDPNLPADSPTWQLIQSIHDLFQISSEIDFKPNAWKYFSTATFKKAMKIYEESARLTNDFVTRRLKFTEESKKKSSELSNNQKSILEKLLDIDERTAQIMASDMLIAGVDTTSNSVLATLYLLAKNPEKQNKLREEVLAKQTRVPYLRACIKESMRMLPVGIGTMRLSTTEYNLLGYRVPKNVLVTFVHQSMAIMKDYYPRPDEFIPERWLMDKDDPLYHGNAPSFAMAPFGYGVRTCMGRRIAELEMRTLITRILENFQIEWTSNEPLQISASLINYISGPFHFVFKDL